MRAMVGFRNVAIHNYQELDTSILRQIIERRLKDFEEFFKECTAQVTD